MQSDFRTVLRRLCRPPCWTKVSTSARLVPCIASWKKRENPASAAINSCTRLIRDRSCWPLHPTNFWSWDITKLLGPAKWTYFYLYVILDVFSRYVTGWMVAHREAAELAKQFIEETVRKHQVPAGQLNIHADRGRVMTSKPVAFLMADLGVTKTHSRPYVSDDNPYSESHFRTMKYRPEFPDRFGCIQDSRAFCQEFFQWYNEDHRHSGIGMLTPAVVHFGEASAVLAHRQVVLDAAYQAHPDRFVRQPPKPLPLPSEVWINKPAPAGQKTQEDSQ
jgi:putative transposase